MPCYSVIFETIKNLWKHDIGLMKKQLWHFVVVSDMWLNAFIFIKCKYSFREVSLKTLMIYKNVCGGTVEVLMHVCFLIVAWRWTLWRLSERLI